MTKDTSLKGLKTILTISVFLGLFSSFYFLGCEEQSSGPFPYPDGIYEGASDLYD